MDEIRRLEASDYHKGYIDLLSQLSRCGDVTEDMFLERFREIQNLGPQNHLIVVIEDPGNNRIVASGTIFVDKKFLRECSSVGHIEDIVVDSSCRGKHLGQKIVNFLVDHARKSGCYKVILDCNSNYKGFYEKCGLKENGLQMAIYFE